MTIINKGLVRLREWKDHFTEIIRKGEKEKEINFGNINTNT